MSCVLVRHHLRSGGGENIGPLQVITSWIAESDGEGGEVELIIYL